MSSTKQLDISVIKTENDINFVKPITTTMFELDNYNEVSGQYILFEYVDVIESIIILYAYSNSLKSIMEYINKDNTGRNYRSAKVPKDEGADCLASAWL